MSDIVHYKGTLKEVPKLENENLEEQCKRILKDNNITIENYDFYDSYQEIIVDAFYKEYVIYQDVLYKVTKDILSVDDDFFIMNKESNGTLTFDVQYYDGGCSFDEAIKEAFENTIYK